jgi:hypothetical protein
MTSLSTTSLPFAFFLTKGMNGRQGFVDACANLAHVYPGIVGFFYMYAYKENQGKAERDTVQASQAERVFLSGLPNVETLDLKFGWDQIGCHMSGAPCPDLADIPVVSRDQTWPKLSILSLAKMNISARSYAPLAFSG